MLRSCNSVRDGTLRERRGEANLLGLIRDEQRWDQRECPIMERFGARFRAIKVIGITAALIRSE